ncbi:TPA: DUF987 domain-containing protein [Escherichia coli]|nr:DUF987 domain-containing protein [Escherichia coli]
MVCEKAAESLHHAERNCTQRTDTSLADERGEAFMSGKNHFTGREVQDIPGVLAVFAERRKDSFGPYVRLMSVTLN